MTTETAARPKDEEPLLDTLYTRERIVITAALDLANGRFLQPTGFPDIDACIYRDKEGRRWCLVESEQSMANRLEAVCMKSPGIWVDELKDLPVIAVRNKQGDLLTTNLTEPHRIASSYVLDGKRDTSSNDMKSVFEKKVGLKSGGDFWPLDKRTDLEKLVFALDPAALLHGFQFVQWKFVGLRQTRLLHARLEAELADEPEVHYGMVKWDAIEPESTREERANKGQSIAAKSRIVPKEITATFEIDLLALKNLALEEPQKRFLLGLALWKIGAFLANKPSFDARSRSTGPSLRLRADCYLRCKNIEWDGSQTSGEARSGGAEGIQPNAKEQLAEGHLVQPQDRDRKAAKLMGALPALPAFRSLVEQQLEDNKEQDKSKNKKGAKNKEKQPPATDAKPFYEGPLVEVTYEPRPKKERGAGAQPQASAPDAEQPDNQQR